MKKLIIVLLAPFILFAAGCKKDEDPVCNLNAANLAGSYKFSSFKYNGTEVLNDTTFFDACSRDDIYTFLSNGTYTITEGQISCDIPTVDGGSWVLTGNSLAIDGEPGDVSGFSCSGFTFTATYTDPTDPTLNETYVIGFARQ